MYLEKEKNDRFCQIVELKLVKIIREKAKKSWGWKKKKTDGFWTNRGFENIRDNIGKKAEKSWG